MLTIPGTLREPEREHEVPLGRRNEQLDKSASNIRSAGGECQVQNRRAHGEQGKNVQRPPKPAPKLAYGVGRDEDTFQDTTEGDLGLPTPRPGVSDAAIGSIKCTKHPTGECF